MKNSCKTCHQTEIHQIPEDWKCDELGNHFELKSGSTPRRSNPKFFRGNIPWVTSSDLNRGIISDTIEKITKDAVKKTNLKIFQKNTFVIALYGLEAKGTRGKCGLLRMDSTINQACMGFLKTGDVEIEYLFYFYLAYGNKIALKFAQGTKQQNLYKNSLNKILIPYPEPSEQEKIIEVLRDMDNFITYLEKLIVKKKNIKKGTMQELLTGKHRLSGFTKKWNVIQLGTLLDYEQPIKYLVKNKNYNDNYNLPVLTAGKTFILGYTNEKKGIFQQFPVIIFDDFTTASKYVDFPFKAKSSAMKMLKPKNSNVNLRFVYESMQLINLSSGEHKRHWLSECRYYEMKVPEINEQNAITEIITDMESEIKILEQNKMKHIMLKEGIMKNLLTGKIRLK